MPGPVKAVRAAARQLDVGAVSDLRVLRSADGPARETLLSDGGVSTGPIPAKLVYQSLDDGTARLAWNLQIDLPSGLH